MTTAIFKSFDNGYFTFMFESGEDMIFDEIHPKALHQFDLVNDENFIDQTFILTYSEVFDEHDEDVVMYRVESLKLA